MATIDELKKVRMEKLHALRELGIDPYPSFVERDHTMVQALDSDGKKVMVWKTETSVEKGMPGQILKRDPLTVACGKGAIILKEIE